jgi:putative phosphoesterase
MVTIGVISDTHLNAVSSDLVDIYERYFSDVEMIFHAGDLVSLEIADYLSQKPLHIVQGNMDTIEVRKRFPAKEIIEVGGFRVGFIHGWGSPFGIEKRIRSEFTGVHAIIYGHSHRPSNHADKGILFFNPGTATGFRMAGSNSIGILRITDEIKGTIIRL